MISRADRVAGLALIALASMLAGCVQPPNQPRALPAPALPSSLAARPPSADRAASATPLPQAHGAVSSAPVNAASAPSVAAAQSMTFTPDSAIRFSLENNPLLLAVREQRGFAQGGVVISRTYPFNPIFQLYTWGVGGPAASGISNRVFNEATMRLDLELRGQAAHRQAAASAVVSRTEWEIATQEVTVSIAAIRAFNGVIYRRRKLEVLEDTITLNEQVVEHVKRVLLDLGRLRAADLIVAQTELDAAKAQLGQGKTALALARADLRRQLGTLDDSFDVNGELDLPIPTTEFDLYAKAARDQRPDLRARQSMVAEAQARLRLQVADRYGNPSLGPSFEYNETSDTFVGLWLVTPIPVLNTRRGEMIQAQATLARAQADYRQFEIQAAQDVQAALARLVEARKWVDSYTGEVLPHLLQAVKDMNRLLELNEPGVDILKVIGVQRNYLRAFDTYLDALFELSQARTDLAASVADPALAIGLYGPPKKPDAPPPALLPPPKTLPAPE